MRHLLGGLLVVVLGCSGGDDPPPEVPDAMGSPDAAAPPDVAPGTEIECTNGLDDDGDGDTDCEDDDCTGSVGCTVEAVCDDGLDDDQDGVVDCLDPDCDGVGTCEVGAELTCDDAADNDADDAIDCADADCDTVGPCELGVELTCDDTNDNDADGAVDCLDADCAGVGPCEVGVEMTCTDNFDNDGNGEVDCDDAACAGAIGCESEPNGTTLTATPFLPLADGRIRGRLDPAGGLDVYQLVIPAGPDQAVQLQTFAGWTGTDMTCLAEDSNLRLLAADGTTVLGESWYMQNLFFGNYRCAHLDALLAPGTYYVEVSPEGAGTTAYSLAIRSETLSTPMPETEPNHEGTPEVGDASEFHEGNDFGITNTNGPYSADTVILAAIMPEGDEDIFVVTNPGTDPVLVFFNTYDGFGVPTTSMDTAIRIRDATAAVLAYGDDKSTDPVSDYTSFVSYELAPAETVYVHVMTYGDWGTVDGYKLLISFP